MMTAHVIAELRALLAKATPGPWKWRNDPLDTGRILVAPGNDDLLMGYDDYQDEANAELIATMHDALPTLLDALDSAIRLVGLAEGVIADLVEDDTPRVDLDADDFLEQLPAFTALLEKLRVIKNGQSSACPNVTGDEK